MHNGLSLTTLSKQVCGANHTLLAVEMVDGVVFRCFTDTGWRQTPNFYGNSKAFLWRIQRPRRGGDDTTTTRGPFLIRLSSRASLTFICGLDKTTACSCCARNALHWERGAWRRTRTRTSAEFPVFLVQGSDERGVVAVLLMVTHFVLLLFCESFLCQGEEKILLDTSIENLKTKTAWLAQSPNSLTL